MKNVVVMWDGLNAWKSAGHPVDPPAAGGAAPAVDAPPADAPAGGTPATGGGAPLLITVPASSLATPVLP